MAMIFTEYSLDAAEKRRLISVGETEVSYVGYQIAVQVQQEIFH